MHRHGYIGRPIRNPAWSNE